MSLISPRILRDFLYQVPTCTQTARLGTLLPLFRGQTLQGKNLAQEVLGQALGYLVLVDEEHKPVGLVSSLQLSALLAQVTSTPTPVQLDSPVAESCRSLITPLLALSAEMTLNQFWLSLGQRPSPAHMTWALVDAEGRHLGLLDWGALLRYLSSHSSANDDDGYCSQDGAEGILAERSVPETRPCTHGIRPAVSLSLLVQCLELLPLPLMLQTSSGQIVTQNAAWREQLEGLLNAMQVTQDANQLISNQGTSIGGVCHRGDTMDSWICSCFMDDGQERLWKFSRLPLPTAWQGRISLIAEEQSVHSASQTAFRLATLAVSEAASMQFTESDSVGGSVLGQLDDSPVNPLESPATLWLVTAQDVTKEHCLKRQLEAQNTDLAQLGQLKDEFLAGISHELKTPLTAILGLSKVLKEQGLGQLTKRQADYVELIHQSGRQLMALVNDVLDLAQIDTQPVERFAELTEIRPLCYRAYTLSQDLYDAEAIATSTEPLAIRKELQVQIDDGLECMRVDALRLRQILTHLFLNALKSSPPEVVLQLKRWEDWVVFSVRDTGIGIPEQEQPLIFQKLPKLDHASHRKFQGTGLGLILTRRLARQQGGEISFTSQPGVGSEFTLLLPAEPQVNTEPKVESPPLSDRLVLVVAADVGLQQDLLQKLQHLHYRVAIARSGNEAVEKARQLRPRLILLTPNLPLLSGWDALTMLKGHPLTATIPVLMMATVAESAQVADQIGYLRGDGLLNLPILMPALERLVAVVEQRLKGLSHYKPAPVSQLVQRIQESSELAALSDLTVLKLGGDHQIPMHYCRVLEADDLEQAALLARIWQPNVLLWDWYLANPLPYLQSIKDHEVLATLPLVTLDIATTRAANQVEGLMVFPCLAGEQIHTGPASQAAATLWQVLQIAVGRSPSETG
jgi:signal transduction histidine kinase/DNA-binding NarL/FixJ family response regulator